MNKRYYIDERVDCIAVRDHMQGTDCPHLDAETAGVAKFWHGEETVSDVCPTCGHRLSHWKVSKESRREAQQLCDKLNKGEAEENTNE